jgi:hypothetical protein
MSKQLSLSPVERSTVMMAFQSPVKDANGGQKGADIVELRKSTRIFDKLRFDDFLDAPAKDEDTTEEVFELDDSDLTYLDRVFREASIWARAPKIAKIVIAIADKIEAVQKEK